MPKLFYYLYFFLALFPVSVSAATLSFTATETASINYGSFNHGTDSWGHQNFTRAYVSNNPSEFDIAGFMKFDFSTIPDNSLITAISLDIFPTTVSNTPNLVLHHIVDDTWIAGGSSPGGLGSAVSSSVSITNSAVNSPFSINLNVNLHNWATDLTDNTLSLALDNTNNSISYVYFDGASMLNPPVLHVTYEVSSVPEPSTYALLVISIIGACALHKKKRIRN